MLVRCRVDEGDGKWMLATLIIDRNLSEIYGYLKWKFHCQSHTHAHAHAQTIIQTARSLCIKIYLHIFRCEYKHSSEIHTERTWHHWKVEEMHFFAIITHSNTLPDMKKCSHRCNPILVVAVVFSWAAFLLLMLCCCCFFHQSFVLLIRC